MTSAEQPTCFRWLLDTRKLWNQEPFEQIASGALSLLKPHERKAVLRHVFTADKKLRLASYLLKYLAIQRTCQIPWSTIILAADEHGKPCYIPTTPSSPGVSFNVSHQAGLVALIGTTCSDTHVGIDIVSVSERAARDIETIDAGGFAAWVDIYTEVFSTRELNDIKHTLPTPIVVPSSNEDNHETPIILIPDDLRIYSHCTGRNIPLQVARPRSQITSSGATTPLTPNLTVNSSLLIDAKIRNFYAHWCLKEAYIKMTGEALLAKWLRDLEFRDVRPPSPAPVSIQLQSSSSATNIVSSHTEEKWGETIRNFSIWRSGQQVRNVQVELSAFEEGHMIATAVSTSEEYIAAEGQDEEGSARSTEKFEELDLERDILSIAEG